MNLPYVLALDYDDSLCPKQVVVAALRRGLGDEIPKDLFDQSLKRASSATYTLASHLQELQAVGFGLGLSAEAARDRVCDALRQSELLFPDVLPFIEKAREIGWRVGIVTFGNREWQLDKIYSSLLPPMDFILTTETRGQKRGILAKAFPTAERVIFIDDSICEVSEAANLHNVEAWLMDRYGATTLYTEEGLLPRYRICRTLEEINL